MQKTVLTFVDDIYEDLELWYPKLRLAEAGYAVRLAAPGIGTFKGKHGYPAESDLLLRDARSTDFCGLLIPGGFMPDKLRRDSKVLSLTREFYEQGKLVAFICHGGWIPISAKILKGKRANRLARHQGRSGKCRRHRGERTRRCGRQSDFQPHAPRPRAVCEGHGGVSGTEIICEADASDIFPHVGREGALRRTRRVLQRNHSARCFAGGDIAARCACRNQF